MTAATPTVLEPEGIFAAEAENADRDFVQDNDSGHWYSCRSIDRGSASGWDVFVASNGRAITSPERNRS